MTYRVLALFWGVLFIVVGILTAASIISGWLEPGESNIVAALLICFGFLFVLQGIKG